MGIGWHHLCKRETMYNMIEVGKQMMRAITKINIEIT